MTLKQWHDVSSRIAAHKAMQRTDHRKIATTHILLSILGVSSAAKSLLEAHGLEHDRVMDVIADMDKPIPQGFGSYFTYTKGALDVIAAAQKLAEKYAFQHGQAYTDYLLVALLQIADQDFVIITEYFGVDRNRLLAAAMEPLEHDS